MDLQFWVCASGMIIVAIMMTITLNKVEQTYKK